jgi:hypothetical protein
MPEAVRVERLRTFTTKYNPAWQSWVSILRILLLRCCLISPFPHETLTRETTNIVPSHSPVNTDPHRRRLTTMIISARRD